MFNLEYSKNSHNWLIWEMIKILKLFNCQNFTIRKIHILRFEKLSNILGVQIISNK